MTWHVVCLAGPHDRCVPRLAPGDRVIEVPFDIRGHPAAIQSSVAKVYAERLLRPEPAAEDFLRAAIGAYTADVRIARDEGYDGWARDMTLHLPVHDTALWMGPARALEELLSFLTGDHWVVSLRPLPTGYRPHRPLPRMRKRWRPDVGAVCLFSGGLDSFIGAVDHIERDGPVALVGHHGAGNGPTSVAQDRVLAKLRLAYGERKAPFLQFWVSPPKGPNRESETTTRGRSLLFLGLAVVAATGLQVARIVVPENGLISLNVPLTPARLGSFSTRTTHPYLIDLVRQILSGVGLPLQVELPYRFSTKGEMLHGCANQAMLSKGLTVTMSCAHPAAGRFGPERNANQHCGRCFPCLIRRAAVAACANGPDPTPYAWLGPPQPLTPTTGADLAAVKIALERYRQMPPRLADVLRAGRLPGSDDELRAYLGVFERGLAELRAFIDQL